MLLTSNLVCFLLMARVSAVPSYSRWFVFSTNTKVIVKRSIDAFRSSIHCSHPPSHTPSLVSWTREKKAHFTDKFSSCCVKKLHVWCLTTKTYTLLKAWSWNSMLPHANSWVSRLLKPASIQVSGSQLWQITLAYKQTSQLYHTDIVCSLCTFMCKYCNHFVSRKHMGSLLVHLSLTATKCLCLTISTLALFWSICPAHIQ